MNSLDALTNRTMRAFAALSFREREVLMYRYGLFDGFTYTTSEIGRIWKKDARWARRVVARALGKIAQRDPGLTTDALLVLHAAGCLILSSRCSDVRDQE